LHGPDAPDVSDVADAGDASASEAVHLDDDDDTNCKRPDVRRWRQTTVREEDFRKHVDASIRAGDEIGSACYMIRSRSDDWIEIAVCMTTDESDRRTLEMAMMNSCGMNSVCWTDLVFGLLCANKGDYEGIALDDVDEVTRSEMDQERLRKGAPGVGASAEMLALRNGGGGGAS
jgi:hypothetical protein